MIGTKIELTLGTILMLRSQNYKVTLIRVDDHLLQIHSKELAWLRLDLLIRTVRSTHHVSRNKDAD